MAIRRQTSISAIKLVDMKSGVGLWSLYTAQSHPYLQIVGVEARTNLREYASAQCWARGCTNVSFVQGQDGRISRSLFADTSFDLVNAAFQMEALLSYE